MAIENLPKLIHYQKEDYQAISIESDVNNESYKKESTVTEEDGFGNNIASFEPSSRNTMKGHNNSTRNSLEVRCIFESPFVNLNFILLSSLDKIYNELRSTIGLTVPIVLSQLGWAAPSFLVASYIGRHFGSIYLDGFTLAMLTGNLCNLSLLEGVFSAMETLLPQAYGAQHFAELESIALRGFIACFIILIPFVTVLAFFMDPLLQSFSEDAEASRLATDWYRIYILSMPFYVVYYTTTTFMSAQSIIVPVVVVVLCGTCIILPVSLYILGATIGFQGTCIAMVVYLAFNSFSLLGYLVWKQPHHPESWPGLQLSSWKQALRWKAFKEFLLLSLGGIFAGSSWIYWEIISLIIGKLGVLELSVHTIPTQIVTILYLVPFGIGVAVTYRIGALLPQSPSEAKEISFYYVLASTLIFGVISGGMYIFRRTLFSFFTKENDVILGCDEIWPLVTIYTFNFCLLGINRGIGIALGKQWMIGLFVVLFMLVLGVPALYYFAIIRGGGLYAAWLAILPPNIAVNISMMIMFTMTDWDYVSNEIQIREGLNHTACLESASLLMKKNDTKTCHVYDSMECLSIPTTVTKK